MPIITDLSSPLSDDELDRLQSILLERVDEDAVTDVASGDAVVVVDDIAATLVEEPETKASTRPRPRSK